LNCLLPLSEVDSGNQMSSRHSHTPSITTAICWIHEKLLLSPHAAKQLHPHQESPIFRS